MLTNTKICWEWNLIKINLDCKDSNPIFFPLATLTGITKHWLFNVTETRTIVKKTFFKRQTMTNWALAAFYKFFPLSLANLLLWKCSLLRVLFTGFWDLLKYFTYLNLYWCWNICSFHFIILTQLKVFVCFYHVF